MSFLPGADDRDQPVAHDIVQFGGVGRRWPGWRWPGRLALAGLLAAAVVVVVVRSGSQQRPLPSPVAVTDIGQPILGVHAGWELFGLDGSGLVSIQFARGRVTRTAVPKQVDDGLVSLVPARGKTFIRPLDAVRGYVVPDDQPARQLTGVLAQGGILLPGPNSAEEWFDNGALLLIGPDGAALDAHLAPAKQVSLSASVLPDGRGGVVLAANDGLAYQVLGTVYDAGSGPPRSAGAAGADTGFQLVAIGPRSWLGLSCTDSGCKNAVLDQATGGLRTLSGTPVSINPVDGLALPGVVAPDGSTAAVIVPGRLDNQAWLDLINLRTGATDQTSVPVSWRATSQSLAWSPDSRWLFAVTSSGKLAVLTRTGRSRALGLGLSGLSQIVMRPADG